VLEFLSSVSVADLIHDYGLLVLFVFVAAESAGIPLPGETAVIAAAIYAGTTRRFDLIEIVSVAAAAAIIGDNFGYLFGRTLGYRLLQRYGTKIGLDQDRLMVAQYLFLRYGGRVVFFGRFVALLRAFTAMLAGANKMPWPRFLVANALGGIVWATIFGCGAYFFGERIRRTTGTIDMVFLFLALITIVVGWRLLRRYSHELERSAREALGHTTIACGDPPRVKLEP
jgi:membrane protein DedA with SNARE-associated domain